MERRSRLRSCSRRWRVLTYALASRPLEEGEETAHEEQSEGEGEAVPQLIAGRRRS